jgi:putative oxidoreductase
MMAKIQMGARIILGLIYFVFGLNGFLNFIHMTPPPMGNAAMDFMKGMMGTGYFFPVLKGTETFGGFLLLTGFAAPLALVVLAPITLHIILFHTYLTPGMGNLILPGTMVLLHLVAMSAYVKAYKPLFSR